MVFAGGTGGHVLVTEFRGMALKGLFCADMLWPLGLVPLTDFTYKYHAAHSPITLYSRPSQYLRSWTQNSYNCPRPTVVKKLAVKNSGTRMAVRIGSTISHRPKIFIRIRRQLLELSAKFVKLPCPARAKIPYKIPVSAS